MFINVYVKKQNNDYYSKKGVIFLDTNSYTNATSFLEFNKKAKFVKKEDHTDFGFNTTDFTNLFYNNIDDKLYTINIK